MSTFKECVEADLSDVFINMVEFAEMHTLEGVELPCVISVNKTAQKSEQKEKTFDGLHGDFITLFVKKVDAPRVPKQGENIKLDDKRYKVKSCRDDMGLLSVLLEAYRMGGAG